MAGKDLDVQRLILATAIDDWISDYEVQGDFQTELSLDPPAAYAYMVAQVSAWIRRSVLIPGDMLDGFASWDGSPEETAGRFAGRAAGLDRVSRPGQICWFDSGPNAAAELAELEAL